MNVADLLLLLTVVVFALRGFSRGLVREFFATIGFAGGVVGATALTPAFSRIIEANSTLPGVVIVGGTFALLYSVICSAAGLAGLLFRRPAAGIGNVLRQLGGALVGAVKAVAVIGLLCFFGQVFRVSPKLDAVVAESLFLRPVVGAGQAVLRVDHVIAAVPELAEPPRL